ncbi:MAG: ImmA/IrrE family metallo-endopeptidase [Clostridia bacterium]
MDEFVINKANQLKKKYGTNDPFKLLEALGVNIKYNYAFNHLKAFYYIMFGVPYVVVNAAMEEAEQKTVAAHELGHHVLHRQLAKESPIREVGFYDMKSGPEYEANLFASELLIDDTEIEELLKEETDYFKICSILEISPELMAFKINSMNKRGYRYRVPVTYKSDFLAK